MDAVSRVVRRAHFYSTWCVCQRRAQRCTSLQLARNATADSHEIKPRSLMATPPHPYSPHPTRTLRLLATPLIHPSTQRATPSAPRIAYKHS